MRKPCIDCGTPSDGTRCPTHATIHQQRGQASANLRRANKGGRSKYGGHYQGAARQVRANATRCWLCLDGPDPTDPWQADHLQQGARNDGGVGGLAAAHRSCNIRRRHLTARGFTTEQIRERLQILRRGAGEGDGAPPLPRSASAEGSP
jgi:hypothetical protein